jgi:hypothetical protein
VDGSGSTIDLSSVTNLTTVSPQILTINGSMGGTVDLHRVTNSVGAVWVDAQDAGTVVNLSGLAGRWKCTSPSGISLSAQTDANINIPNVTQLEDAALEVDNTGVIPTAQLNLLTNCTLTVDGATPNFSGLTNIDDTSVYAKGGGVARLTSVMWVMDGNLSPVWHADGVGSLIDLSSGLTLYGQAWHSYWVEKRDTSSVEPLGVCGSVRSDQLPAALCARACVEVRIPSLGVRGGPANPGLVPRNKSPFSAHHLRYPGQDKPDH